MGAYQPIDPTFNFLSDAGGDDPDATSPTLRAFHKRLWSKPLPGGDPFELVDTRPNTYLYHASKRGEFFLSSDAAVPTWTRWVRPVVAGIVGQMPEPERDEFNRITWQMGGIVLFPSNQIDGQTTINQERGRCAKIADRLDLTVECIRRHYLGEPSPMTKTLERYADFFRLFDNFTGYTEFWLLQDLVSDDRTEVNVFMPYDNFKISSLPTSLEAYRGYRDRAVAFVQSRNRRMIDCTTGQ
jgi:hypothetical protein